MQKKRTNKLSRYVKVFRRGLKRLNRKKVLRWLNKNLKTHPFILGILFFIWVTYVIGVSFGKRNLAGLIKFHLVIFIAWLCLVILSNSLKDKQKVRWYFKKRLVFFMLALFYPLGLIFLWTGAKLKKTTKIALTVIFTLFFLTNVVHTEKKHKRLLKMPAFERITEIIAEQEGRVFLKQASAGALSGFKFLRIPGKAKPKFSISEIYSRCSPGIASIKVISKQGEEIGTATGFVISENGLLVTNAHVIKQAHKAEIKIGDRVFSEAYLVKNIPKWDIAVLKIDAEGLLPLAIGNSDKLTSGQFIVTLGNPLGLEQSLSTGVISAIRSSPNIKLIQMTAPVSPGSSGSPVVNEYGEVVGVATIASFFFAQNVNFAIPINYLVEILDKKKSK